MKIYNIVKQVKNKDKMEDNRGEYHRFVIDEVRNAMEANRHINIPTLAKMFAWGVATIHCRHAPYGPQGGQEVHLLGANVL